MLFRGDSVKKSFRALEWPGETAGAARATIIGKNRALIENFDGIIEFTSETVRLSARGGEIVVNGENIEIEQARARSLIVRGRIGGVTLPKGENA